MNEDTKKLREIVERATAAGDRIPADLDAETASLRQGWLEFGKLIEHELQAGGSPADGTSGELERAGAELAEFGRMLAAAPTVTPTKSNHRPVWKFVVAAVAASLLVAAGAVFWLRSLPASHQQSNADVVNVDQNKQPIDPAHIRPEADVRPAPEFSIIASTRFDKESFDKGVTVVSRATMAVVVPLSLF